MIWSSFWLLLIGVDSKYIRIEDDNQKNVNLETFHRKVQKEDLNQQRLNPQLTNQSKFSQKIEKDKVSSLLGTQVAETNSEFGAVYRITCWDASANGRAGCIYQAPNRFSRGGVTHFWLASETHSIRWIHFYDANVVPTNSAPYQSDYAICHTNSKFEGIDYVNFIVMFEQVNSNADSIPKDPEWVVYSDPEETWNTALFSFPSNYEGNRARTNIKTINGRFQNDNIVIIKFPSVVKNLHFDDVDGMRISGIQAGNYAQVVTLTNIPPYIEEIWFDFEYMNSERGNSLDPVGNWFDATMTTVNIY
jgi:hypothetical protein